MTRHLLAIMSFATLGCAPPAFLVTEGEHSAHETWLTRGGHIYWCTADVGTGDPPFCKRAGTAASSQGGASLDPKGAWVQQGKFLLWCTSNAPTRGPLCYDAQMESRRQQWHRLTDRAAGPEEPVTARSPVTEMVGADWRAEALALQAREKERRAILASGRPLPANMPEVETLRLGADADSDVAEQTLSLWTGCKLVLVLPAGGSCDGKLLGAAAGRMAFDDTTCASAVLALDAVTKVLLPASWGPQCGQ